MSFLRKNKLIYSAEKCCISSRNMKLIKMYGDKNTDNRANALKYSTANNWPILQTNINKWGWKIELYAYIALEGACCSKNPILVDKYRKKHFKPENILKYCFGSSFMSNMLPISSYLYALSERALNYVSITQDVIDMCLKYKNYGCIRFLQHFNRLDDHDLDYDVINRNDCWDVYKNVKKILRSRMFINHAIQKKAPIEDIEYVLYRDYTNVPLKDISDMLTYCLREGKEEEARIVFRFLEKRLFNLT